MAQVKACASEVKQIQQSAGGTDPETLKRFNIRAETSGPTASHVYQSVPELPAGFSGTVHPSDCSSACCGLPLRGDGSADECRRMGPVLVIVDACGRRPPRQLSAPSDGRSLAHEHHRTPHIRSLRALRPASAAAFLRKNRYSRTPNASAAENRKRTGRNKRRLGKMQTAFAFALDLHTLPAA